MGCFIIARLPHRSPSTSHIWPRTVARIQQRFDTVLKIMLLPTRQDQNLAGSSSMATHRLLEILRILNIAGLMCNRVAHAPAIALTDEPESTVLSCFRSLFSLQTSAW